MDQAARAVKAVVMRFLELARHTAVGGRAWQSTGNGHQRRRRIGACRKSPGEQQPPANGTIRELAAQAAIGHQGATVEWRWWGGG